MMKVEFEELIEDQISQEDYSKIETVYVWYPSFGDKRQAATLYREFGMRIFEDLLPRAEKARKLEEQMHDLQSAYDATKREFINL